MVAQLGRTQRRPQSAKEQRWRMESDLKSHGATAGVEVNDRYHGADEVAKSLTGTRRSTITCPLQHTESFRRILVPCHLVLQVRLCKQPVALHCDIGERWFVLRTLRPIGSGTATRSVQRETWLGSQYRLHWAAGGEPAAWRRKNLLRSPPRRRPRSSLFASGP